MSIQGIHCNSAIRIIVLCIATFGLHPAYAQLLQGTIDGNVTDSSQSAVAGARVVAVNQQTNFSRETVTNSTGLYTIPTLPPGTYTITVNASGFSPYSRTGVV